MTAQPSFTPAGLAPLTADLEQAHHRAVLAAVAGLSDFALGPLRLGGNGVPVLAEAAISSATPFLRAPLLARISAALRLHGASAEPGETCAVCGTPAPCATSRVLW
jgi:hypothetical protein